ncbi:hypothetical protein NQ318_017857 [Aromia moschata]|uniref:Leucine-rich repeat-containing protein 23 n=1 Tax=Aromia moschata TaxID=1265417 RepID=A0AAV8XQN8_9CUCU|nr:hypothetical protein NQ318_017857 [Aromia moschata]
MEEEKPLAGEGVTVPPTPHFVIDVVIKERKLTFEEASQCLNTLGKDESGVRYAYLMITAREKKLTDVSTILNFKHVLFLDLGGNHLDLNALQVLSGMAFLIYLKAERNRVESAALDPMHYLQVLILSMNQITETCDINQPLLENLELAENLIYTVQFDAERLANLKFLNLKANHLIDLSGTFPPCLERLYVAQNDIIKLNMDCYNLRNLRILHLRDNNIRKLNGFTEELEHLTYLNVRGNKIHKVRQFRKLACLPRLDTLILLENPLYGLPEAQQDEEAPKGEEDEEAAEDEEEAEGEEEPTPVDKMRLPLLVLLPRLKRINKEPVRFEEKEAAEAAKKKIEEDIYAEESSEEETEMPTTTDFTTDYTTETEMDKEEEEEEEDEERGENEDVTERTDSIVPT